MKSGASIIAESIEKAVDYKLARATRPQSKTVTGTYLGKDGEGKAWVRLSGANGSIPIRRMSVQADVGDTVSVTVGGGRAVVDSNISNPSASSTNVATVGRRAVVAQETASKAVNYAVEASAASAAARASANGAQVSAERALVAADTAEADAARAHEAADDAMAEAVIAHEAADSAQSDATIAGQAASAANKAANSALDQLGVVQDVVGVLNYVAEHGGFVLTQDQAIVDGKVYFTLDSQTGDYVPVVDPQASQLSSYYEVSEDYDDVMGDFIMAHLAVTSRGLWVLPSGIGSSTTPASGESQADSDARQGNGYKLLLSNNGSYIYDGSGALVITYGANIEPSVDRPFYIGDPNSTSYILFTPASGSTPASISIGGSVKIGTSKTLSELLAEVDAKAARGTGILNVTTAPSSYTTQTGGFTPAYRIALSTVKSQAGVDEVIVGDVIEYSFYHYPVGYVDSGYAYTGARTSIRGATGTAGGRWYTGTGITGTSTTATVFSGSGVSSAVVGDMYLNTDTDNTYRCTTAGDASTAKWVYVANIEGEQGPTGPEAIVSVYPTAVDFGASTATLTANLLVDGSAPTSTPTYQWSKGSTTLGTSQTQAVTDLSAVYTCVVTWGTNVQAGCFDFGSLAEAAAVAGNYIIETASNDVWVHSEGHGPNSSGVATSDTYGWRIGSVFELVMAGATYIKMWVDNSVAKLVLGLAEAGHAVFSPDGMEVFAGTNGADSMAKFGSETRIGKSGGARFVTDASSLQAYDSSNAKYFEVSSSGLTWGTNTAATTTQVSEAAKRTYVSITVTAVDFNADTATLEATLYVDGAAKTSSVTYAWLKDGTAMSGETARTLSVTTAKGGLEHAYSCTATY